MVLRPEDERFMAAAIRLSRRHLGLTSTNPSVGCIIVKDDVVLGSAVTALGGRPHAEPQALAEAGEAARGATAYVTLEPCSHYGKTPPCAEALITYGVARVVISVTDPDQRVSGRGIAMLRDAGIEVDAGILEAEGRRSLAGYLMRQTRNRPYVTLKLAVSADGMIGKTGAGQVRITGDIARAQVQMLRAESDAILVGIGTAISDDPELTCRLPGLEDRSPLRIVIDGELRLPLGSKLVRTARQYPVIAVAGHPPSFDDNTDAAFLGRRAALDAAGVEVLQSNSSEPGELLEALGTRGISSLLVEGGARTAQRFLDAGLVDRILLFRGPADIGEGGIESPVLKSNIPADFMHVGESRFGDDLCDEYERGF
ncbi:bifunctional diaminohydroxyphosphoribosylaminopyrimidine deaminase/5-amino-6-(5-phosphoribosylamino)uracil reductase RibD [Rhizobium sp. AG207R]|uniref:bifunctional diaminohydroxyphosphoribosylaminopyrimidine deaminase/5-amino-6-(5-phosphoribosylamino)uracil reductase RibD n=1 Tax=Rhizobium sp. AG207R TaxID=2802287 RepID=UPI0022ABCCD0|nr:bifunctional diaminohydroxyphosphoribosylaminopyrimidine deaminase/5-amino-6-(5-phosphoribosylamino)uracil reductase RibD [Rhizobium sp. AG207R]MCZ3379531.1 bifunctional diaminohydroxyphosphoribosylaminopyrimidine deaminase/5-amino-6-(5-phosphoribosylamino)uracil reductase RibD [Rhizobium sp. AG207R]